MLPDPGYLMHILNLKTFDYTVKTVGTLSYSVAVNLNEWF